MTNAVACAVPLTTKSTAYQFCFQNPTEQAVMDLQRKGAAAKAEKALENVTGCARTDGDIDKSKGSGRITRALVHKSDDQAPPSLTKARSKGASVSKGTNDTNFESTQAKCREMKSVPMEVCLAARHSHIHGWGLFAKQDFPKNSMIAKYMGEAISQLIADKREKKYEILGMGSCYMFRLDFHETVDATQISCTSWKLYYKWTMTNPTTYDDSFLYIVTEYKISIFNAMRKRSIFKHFRAVILNNFIKN